MPINRSGATITIAMVDPSNIFAIDDIKFMTGYNVEAVVATEGAIVDAIKKYYGGAKSLVPSKGGAAPSVAEERKRRFPWSPKITAWMGSKRMRMTFSIPVVWWRSKTSTIWSMAPWMTWRWWKNSRTNSPARLTPRS